MAVATAVVAVALLTASIANIFVSAQSRCPALLQGIERAQGKAIGLALVNILTPKPINDLGNFKLRTHYYFWGYKVSNGLWAPPGGIWATCK